MNEREKERKKRTHTERKREREGVALLARSGTHLVLYISVSRLYMIPNQPNYTLYSKKKTTHLCTFGYDFDEVYQ